MIKGSFYILIFYFLGELFSKIIHNFIPGSVLGMILLFLALFFKLLRPDNVREVATAITKNMAVFFVPAAVGLMVYAGVLAKNLIAIVIAIGGSTVLIMVTVSLIQERFEKHKTKQNGDK